MFIPIHRPPTTPGEMLEEEYRKPLGMTQDAFAKALGLDRVTYNNIVRGRRGISTHTALKLGKALRTTPQFWLNLQMATDIYHEQRRPEVAKELRTLPELIGSA